MAIYGRGFQQRDRINAVINRGMDGNRQSVGAIQARIAYHQAELTLARAELEGALDIDDKTARLVATATANARIVKNNSAIETLAWVLGEQQR